MSQRTFSRGNFEVFTGWDRPLTRFFLVIERKDAKDEDEDEDEGYAFSNLKRKNPAMSLEEISETLAEFNIEPPSSLIEDLKRDQRNNEGDLSFNYDTGKLR